MTEPTISIYLIDISPLNIWVQKRWKLKEVLMTFKSIIKLIITRKISSDMFVCYRFIPGQRFKFISTMNCKLFYMLLQLIAKNTDQIYAVWIRDQSFYKIQNIFRWRYLILDVNKEALIKNTDLMYKPYFQKGWIFMYIMDRKNGECTAKVFKDRKLVYKELSNYLLV